MRTYLEVLNAALAGPGLVDVENDATVCTTRSTSPTSRPTSILLAASAAVMLRIAGEHASGTILWMADERARSAITSSRASPRRLPARAGRPRASSRGFRSRSCRNDEVDDACAWANRVLGHAEYSPNYERLLEQGDATDVGDVLASGDESAIVERLRSFRDAGVTDLAVRVLPLGADRETRASSRGARTETFVASLCPEL